AHTRAARAKGFPARSVFKLEEIDRRVRLFKTGQRVLDLGAAPGSWSLYAAGRVGPSGRVLAIDLSPIEQHFPEHVDVVEGDALVLESEVLARHGPYDVVLSDMAPSTSGTKGRDQALSFELFMRALEVAKTSGKPRSHFVGKIFMSGDFQEARRAVAEAYERCQVIRPEVTRAQSSEVFVVGIGLRQAKRPDHSGG
ncbi:MAG TPA: RlmE family RNA methyltransferase, partial [Polyangiaceae bacterium]|nr:RlmE family RNA methyltransferase [Polyangiaceae bacterium]